MPDEGKSAAATTPPEAAVREAGYSVSVAVAPTDPGSAGTQTPAATTAIAVLPTPVQGALLDFPLLTVLEQADQHSSTLALSAVARATVSHLVSESRRKDEQIKDLTTECKRLGDGWTEERITVARLETAKDVPLGIIGMAVLGLAGILVGLTSDTTVRIFAASFGLLGIVAVLLGLRRLKGWVR